MMVSADPKSAVQSGEADECWIQRSLRILWLWMFHLSWCRSDSRRRQEPVSTAFLPSIHPETPQLTQSFHLNHDAADLADGMRAGWGHSYWLHVKYWLISADRKLGYFHYSAWACFPFVFHWIQAIHSVSQFLSWESKRVAMRSSQFIYSFSMTIIIRPQPWDHHYSRRNKQSWSPSVDCLCRVTLDAMIYLTIIWIGILALLQFFSLSVNWIVQTFEWIWIRESNESHSIPPSPTTYRYTCPDQPRHMSVAVDTLNYRLPYKDIFGGVSALTRSQMQKVNGFSNEFWGWGGEDDDMANRIKYYGFKITRYRNQIARYKMLKHKKDTPNPERSVPQIDVLIHWLTGWLCPNRYKKLYKGRARFKTDGLNSLQYNRVKIEYRKLFTWILVDPIDPKTSPSTPSGLLSALFSYWIKKKISWLLIYTLVDLIVLKLGHQTSVTTRSFRSWLILKLQSINQFTRTWRTLDAPQNEFNPTATKVPILPELTQQLNKKYTKYWRQGYY